MSIVVGWLERSSQCVAVVPTRRLLVKERREVAALTACNIANMTGQVHIVHPKYTSDLLIYMN